MRFRKSKPPTFGSLLHAMTRFGRAPLRRGVRHSGADRYVKKHRSVEFALALVSYYLLGLTSVRQLKTRLDCDRHLRRHVQLERISHAQLPKLLSRRPSALWAPLITALLSRLSTQRVPSCLRIMDTSFFAMSVKLFSRCHGRPFAPEAAGVKLGMVLDPHNGAPLEWDCRVGQNNDVVHLESLVPPDAPIAGLTYLFDRGFRKYEFFQSLMDRGADFITRATGQISYQVLQARPLDGRHPQIRADAMVHLGAPTGRAQVSHPIRRIELRTQTETLVFLTSRLDLSALEVTQLYRRRWEIEVFFRWLKSTIRCHKPLAYSATAAEHTICAALVAYLLTVLFAQLQLSRATHRPTAQIKKALTHLRAELYDRPKLAHLRALGFA